MKYKVKFCKNSGHNYQGLMILTMTLIGLFSRVLTDFKAACKGTHNPLQSSLFTEIGVADWRVKYAPSPENIYWYVNSVILLLICTDIDLLIVSVYSLNLYIWAGVIFKTKDSHFHGYIGIRMEISKLYSKIGFIILHFEGEGCTALPLSVYLCFHGSSFLCVNDNCFHHSFRSNYGGNHHSNRNFITFFL